MEEKVNDFLKSLIGTKHECLVIIRDPQTKALLFGGVNVSVEVHDLILESLKSVMGDESGGTTEHIVAN